MDIEQWRPALESYAYNILGTYEDARDVVQDVLLKQLDRPTDGIDNYKNYLIKSVVNRSINLKKRQQKMRSDYIGPWLPEPIATEQADRRLHLKDILNYSMMVLMEKLTPKERAVFILKEAFHYAHEEIAEVLDITLENSRQLLSRARKALQHRNLNPPPPSHDLIQEYVLAIQQGNVKKLEQLFREEITITSDGGGKVLASRRPVVGRERVIKFIMGLFHKYQGNASFQFTVINYQPALLLYVDDQLVTCQVFETDQHHIGQIYYVRNPDKLNFLKK